jgi:uncharacterized lipoprotein YddW (UPF0748 family)
MNGMLIHSTTGWGFLVTVTFELMKQLPVLFAFLCLPLCGLLAQTYEFRGVWIGTVANIDWPREKGLNSTEQQEDFKRILDLHQRNGINAVFVQVRPAADAFYPSPYEPWSEFLSGRQGVAPNPYYDPLQFMIEETHKRGMEFHAWLNPYRAVFTPGKSSVAANHITKTHPEWFLMYGEKKYFNPGLPEVRNYVTNIVKDITSRYDVDGIHMDDYFYPYRIAGKEFPDKKTFDKYSNGLQKDDWRRSNCDSIVKQIHDAIRALKPTIKFGISPFGVWRNKSQDPRGSNTRGGQTNYDDLYADILLWMEKGWIDYVAPQLYWERGHKLCDYDTLLHWWNQYTYGRHLYIGHGVYRAGTNAAWRNRNELPMEIQNLRAYETTQGSIYFSSKNFESNPNGWNDSLRNNYYALPALPPPMEWLDSTYPDKPVIDTTTPGIFRLGYEGKKQLKAFAIFTIEPGEEANYANAVLVELIAAGQPSNISPARWTMRKQRVFVASVDRSNNISDWIEVK